MSEVRKSRVAVAVFINVFARAIERRLTGFERTILFIKLPSAVTVSVYSMPPLLIWLLGAQFVLKFLSIKNFPVDGLFVACSNSDFLITRYHAVTVLFSKSN